MKLEALQVEIRPRTAGQTFSLAARMLQHRPVPLLAAWASYSVPTAALALLLLVGLELNPWWVWLVTLTVAPLFSLPMVSTAGQLVFSPSVSLGTVVRMSVSRLLPFVALFLANRVLVLLGSLALLVPGLYLWRSSWFLGPIVLLERSPMGAAFRRGQRFAAGYQGHALGHAFHAAAVLLYLVLASATLLDFLLVQVLGLSVGALAELRLYDHYVHLLGLLGFALAAPLVTLMWFFTYLDVRIRKEGWDLELAFRARASELGGARGL